MQNTGSLSRWTLPLPASLTHISIPQVAEETFLNAIPTGLASRLTSVGMGWTDLKNLKKFPQLRHLTLEDQASRLDEYEDVYVPRYLERLTTHLLPPLQCVSGFLQNLPPTLRAWRSVVSHSPMRIDLPSHLVNLTELDITRSPKYDWAKFGPAIANLPLTRLQCALSAPYFSCKHLPETLTHFSLEMQRNATWMTEYSKQLPRSLTSLECLMETEKAGFYSVFKEMPPKVTRLSLPLTSNITIEEMERDFPKTLVELLLPRHMKLLDVDLARIPRYWRVLKLGSLLVTGRTFNDDVVGSLSLKDFNASIARLLPPQMPPFWAFHPSVFRPTSDMPRLVTQRGGMTLPPGITELDLLGVGIDIDALDPLFDGPKKLLNLRILRSENFTPPTLSPHANPHENYPIEGTNATVNSYDDRPYMPASLKTFYSNFSLVALPERYGSPAIGIYPKGLVSLHLPSRDLFQLPKLPNLEVLEVAMLHKTTLQDFSILPHLHTLILRKATGPYLILKALPNSLTSLKIVSENQLILVSTGWSLPQNLRSLQMPNAIIDLSYCVSLPPTLTHFELNSISVRSSQLASVLPTSHQSSTSQFIAAPNDSLRPEDSPLPLETKLTETQISELKSRIIPEWISLTELSPSKLIPIVEFVLKACHPELKDLKFGLTVEWELEDLPFLPPNLETLDIPLSIQRVVSQLETGALTPESDGGAKKARVRFFSPKKGRMAMSRVDSAPVLAQMLFKTCYTALPQTLTQLKLHSLELPHWVPKLLPRTLTLLSCDGSHFNTDSYRQLPSSLLALGIRTSGKFHRKHAAALPVGLKSFEIVYEALVDSTIGHLPRGLEYFSCAMSWALTRSCLSLLPPHLKILLFPHSLRVYSSLMDKIPASVTHLGSGYFSHNDSLLPVFLASLSENQHFLTRILD
jgi:hypothetical protein